MPEVEARRALSGRIGAFSVLAPVGSYAGKGVLRVLRVRSAQDERIELTCGYESYEPVSTGSGQAH
jgi:hypothetical protein